MKSYNSLAISRPDDLLFGVSPHPVTTRQGLVIGGGTVYPELNFTLPTMMINESTFPVVLRHYSQIVKGALTRAAELNIPGVVLEFETLPPMTEHPEWALEITKTLLDGMAFAKEKYSVKSALRMTPNDNREMKRPPLMRSGKMWEKMIETFEGSCELGADFLSIESVGGKEIHDEALTMCDIRQVIFSLCIMGVRDMRFLWTEMVAIAKKHGTIPAGDTACGFGNTAMVLAEQKMIPRVFAAVVRAISAVRSLVAYECGAVGPGKDCGYENAILKAITGHPMSMEGKSAAGAHLSPLGNIASAACDMWSNESIQNLKLLGGMAPTVGLEQLVYDCRLMNTAADEGKASALQLRDWLVKSDALRDPQAYILTPSATIELADAIVAAPDEYHAGINVARKAVEIINRGYSEDGLIIPKREMRYLKGIEKALDEMPDREDAFIDEMMAEVDTSKFVAQDYGLA